MEMYACTCDGLPAHDHFMGHRVGADGVYGPVWDQEDIGHVWVDWKKVSRALMQELGKSVDAADLQARRSGSAP
jgi:hypothetical protein